MKNKKRPGFTLVELIVVLAIIAVLLVMIVPRVTAYVEDARTTAAQNSASAVVHAAELYVVEQVKNGHEPAATLENGGALEAYLDHLNEDDQYHLTLTYNASESRYDISGTYTTGNITVQIPDMTIAGETDSDER